MVGSVWIYYVDIVVFMVICDVRFCSDRVVWVIRVWGERVFILGDVIMGWFL